MSQEFIGKEQDPRIVYKDIIDLPHHQSSKHPHMSLYDRAAQFAPFAALTGYEDMVHEEARVTDSAITLGEAITDRLNQKLSLISDAIKKGHRPTLAITYFVPDLLKSGGEYVTINEQIHKIDSVNKKIVLMKTSGTSQINETIDFEMVTDIQGDFIDYLDDYID